jgi:heme/copper-type cytochrome/quinol oxidase subunit 2
MHDVHDVEEAERMGRARSRIFFVLAMVFFAGQSLYFTSSPATRDFHARIGAWLILVIVILILMLLATGGFLLRGRKVRDLLNDETFRINRLASQALGFWVTIVTALVLYVESIFDPLTFNEGVHVLVTLGVGSALISFAVRERRAHRLG